MLLNLSDVFTSEGKAETHQIPLELTGYCFQVGEAPVLEKEPVLLTITHIRKGEVRVEGSARLTFGIACDRCLEEVPTRLEFSFDRIARSPEFVSGEDEETDEIVSDGYQLDVEALVQDEISLNWPVKILCRTDCRGICPVCGQNLNERECGCDRFVPDPRMAGIKDLFDQANKEV